MPEYADSITGLENVEWVLEYVSESLGRIKRDIDNLVSHVNGVCGRMDFDDRALKLGYNPLNLPKA